MTFSPIGFPAQPRQDLMSRLIGQLRDQSDTARQEVVTGFRADPAAALNGKVSELLGMEQSLAEIAQYREIISLASARAAVTQSTLGVLRDFANELNVSGQTALDSTLPAAGEAVSVSARQALGAAISALNISFGGRRLFAGDAGDSPAVASVEDFLAASVPILEAGPTAGAAYANLTVDFTGVGGLFDTSLYTGGSGNAPASEVARGERLDFAQRADAAPIRALLRDLVTLAAAFDPGNAIPEDNRRALAGQAIAGLRDNVVGLVGMASRVGAAEERMATVAAHNQASESGLTLAYMSLAGRDQFEAAAELTNLETQLETTYLATARLANLSLANFLR
jgi:flagellar hook-associated protein 3 FlgL